MSDFLWTWHRCSIQSHRAIFCCSLSGSWFENRKKTAHVSVKYQLCLSNALITALEIVLLCHVSYNHLNYATTVAVGHCREHHHQKMSSVTFRRTIEHCSGTGTPVCQPRFCCSSSDYWQKTFLRGIKLAHLSCMVRCPGSQPMHTFLLRHLSQKQNHQLCSL